MLVGSVANGLNSSGGFCAGSRAVVDHQRINVTSFVFAAAVPALAVSASGGINILRNIPSEHSTRERARYPRSARLDRCRHDSLAHRLADHPHLAAFCNALRIRVRQARETRDPAPRDGVSFDIAGNERVLQDIVDEVLAQGVWITRARPSIRLAVTAALSRKECERAAGVIKAAVAKVLVKRK